MRQGWEPFFAADATRLGVHPSQQEIFANCIELNSAFSSGILAFWTRRRDRRLARPSGLSLARI